MNKVFKVIVIILTAIIIIGIETVLAAMTANAITNRIRPDNTIEETFYFTIEKDGHLRVPRDFVDIELPEIDKEYSKLNKAEKKEYDKYYLISVTYLVSCYNEANKKYNAIFEGMNIDEKQTLLREEINMLNLDLKKAEMYLAGLAKQDKEKQQDKLGKKNLTKAQILEVNEEITQIKYISAEMICVKAYYSAVIT